MAGEGAVASDRQEPETAIERQAALSIVCLGVGGGPLETNCSCYLAKPSDAKWEDGTVLLEGGSFLGTLASLLRDAGKRDSAFHDIIFDPDTDEDGRAGQFNTFIRSVLISHGHLDHIFGLVLASASQRGQRPVYGTEETLQAMLDVFNGRTWPPLASYDASDPLALYHLRRLMCEKVETIAPGIQVTPFALSHGKSLIAPTTNDTDQQDSRTCGELFGRTVVDMQSTAFLLTNMHLDRHVLFFGDVESDETGNMACNHNIWIKVAPLFVQKRLNTVFIECSFTDAQPRELLFGHFSPNLLYQDLRDFARCVAAYRKTGDASNLNVSDDELIGALRGLRCVIIHIKGLVQCCAKLFNKNESLCTSYEGAPLGAQAIASQISEHESNGRLGVRFHIAKRGERLEC